MAAGTASQDWLDLIPKEAAQDGTVPLDLQPFLFAGDRVLIVGARRGLLTFIAARLVGSEGYVLGLEAKNDRLVTSRDVGAIVALRLGFRNMDFQPLELIRDRNEMARVNA